MKQIILFDVDHTIFDTDTWTREYVRPALMDLLDTTPESLDEVAQQYQATLEKYTDFNPEDYLEFLANEFEVEFQTLRQVFFTPAFMAHSVFSDVFSTLEALKKHHRLGILSEANEAYQRTKLTQSGLLDHFEPELTFILHRKTEPAVLEELVSATIVDDNPKVIAEIAQYDHLEPIWLNRRDDNQQATVRTIRSLKELL